MYAAGEIDPTRLACAMTAVPSLTSELGPVLLALASPDPAPYRRTSGHARSVQQAMAGSDNLQASMRAASAARSSATAAAQRGDDFDAARYSTYAARLMREAQQTPSTGGPRAYPVGSEDEPVTDLDVLEEYAWHQARLAALDPADEDSEDAREVRARVAEISAIVPEVAETYADLLLYVYRDSEFACA
jgi:hypothetical protein